VKQRCVAAALLLVGAAGSGWAGGCAKPVYLTFDTGHMGVADLVAQVLQRQQVKATFFLAAEKTLEGGHSLDERWAPWWQARAAEGHAFGSHTFDHVYWRGDRADGGFDVRPSAGPQAGVAGVMDRQAYCAELERPARRFQEMTGQTLAPLFRAPGGKTSAALLQAAAACGWTHVGWAPAGFLGDELSSERYPNERLLRQALRHIRAGDILLAHLGIWSRRDPWAPAVLEPLIVGLKSRGFCFATLAEHPGYRDAVASARARPAVKR
jgi:peptidoglycan/xylan/chitin deacetylase (PgdA/CDA1 family)